MPPAQGISVRITEGASEAHGPLFIDGAFNRFQARVQDKAIVELAAIQEDGRPLAWLTLAGVDGAWTSPVTGAFGGVACAGGSPQIAAIEALVSAALERLRPAAKRLTVRLPPDGHGDPVAAGLENVLHRVGFRLEALDLNYHIPLSGAPAWEAALGETRRKELRRLERDGAVFDDSADGEAVHTVIAENRASRGFPMTMSWPQVRALAEAFPDRVGFAAVRCGGDLLAGAIHLQVSDACEYVFYWGEHPSARRRSPVVLLARGLVAKATARGAAILDLGTSTDHSQPNTGLIAFKESVGARASARRTYVLEL